MKDQALIWADGSWHLLFSYVTNDTAVPGQEDWDIANAESTDFVHWSAPTPWTEQPGGMASPDLVRSPSGQFVATYDSPPGESGSVQAKPYYRTSSDLVHWSAPQPLAHDLYPAPGDRMIDPALAWTGNGLILAYKVGTTSRSQAFEIAWSKSGSLDGPWVVIGRPHISAYGDTFENYELVSVDGTWRLVATSNTFDQPWMYTLSGNPARPASWLHWKDGRELRVPAQAWNTGSGISSVNFEHANSAYMCQDPANGYTYLTYAGSTELTQFRRMGTRRNRGGAGVETSCTGRCQRSRTRMDPAHRVGADNIIGMSATQVCSRRRRKILTVEPPTGALSRQALMFRHCTKSAGPLALPSWLGLQLHALIVSHQLSGDRFSSWLGMLSAESLGLLVSTRWDGVGGVRITD